jgi:hypothetical protein
MRKIFFTLLILTISAFLISFTIYKAAQSKANVTSNNSAATCYGYKNCNACKNCKYCKHCAKDGGTCGVCK